MPGQRSRKTATVARSCAARASKQTQVVDRQRASKEATAGVKGEMPPHSTSRLDEIQAQFGQKLDDLRRRSNESNDRLAAAILLGKTKNKKKEEAERKRTAAIRSRVEQLSETIMAEARSDVKKLNSTTLGLVKSISKQSSNHLARLQDNLNASMKELRAMMPISSASRVA